MVPCFYSDSDVEGLLGTTIFRSPNVAVLTPAQVQAAGATTLAHRPCFVRYRGDVYVVGCYSRPFYYPRRDPKWIPVGIKPPDQVITVVPGAGVDGSTGTGLCFITYQHRAGDVMLSESNASNIVQVALTGTGRAWGNLTTPNVEKHVTHVAGYCSMNGSNYRRAFLAPYGVVTYSENVKTAGLTIEGPDHNYLPPAGAQFACEFAGSMWYAATAEHPYRLWYSEPGFPQNVPLANIRDTLERDGVVGIAKLQNVLLVGTRTGAYALRAPSFIPEKLDSAIGLLSHFGIREIHNKLWIPSQDGYYIFDGAGFYFAMKDIRPYWLADFLANESVFYDGFAVDDKVRKNLIFITQRPARTRFEDWEPGTVRYVGSYLNFERTMGGAEPQPDWEVDVMGRVEASGFYGTDNQLYLGYEDGKVRIEDDADPDDDGDTLAKPLLIEGGCLLFQEPGDDVEHGKKLDQLWVYMESETSPWSAYVLMGDEWACRRIEPDNVWSHWKTDVAASAKTDLIADPYGGQAWATYIPETTHFLGVPEGVTGRGLTMRFRAAQPVGLRFRGYGGIWSPGAGPRHEAEVLTFSVELNGAPIVPNTPTSRIRFVTGSELNLFMRLAWLAEAFAITYPVHLVWTFTGALEATTVENIAAGLDSEVAPFSPPDGDSTLVVAVTVNGQTASKTFYFASHDVVYDVLGPVDLVEENTPETAYPPPIELAVSMSPDSDLTYPINVTYTATGANPAVMTEQILSGAFSAGVTIPTPAAGEVRVDVVVEMGGVSVQKTFYYHVGEIG